MAAKLTKKQLLDKLEALGVDATAEMTAAQLQKLLKEAASLPVDIARRNCAAKE